MIARLKSFAFASAYVGWTVIACILAAWGLLAPRRTALNIVVWYLHGVAWLERNLLGLTYRVIGAPSAGPAIYAIKHQSTFETMKLHLLFDDPAIVLKAELMRLPIWGSFARKLGMIPVVRGTGMKALLPMLDAARDAIAAGRPIVIFPQGTRVPPGDQRPYKQGVARLYDLLQLPVVPVAIDSGLFWPKHGQKRGGTITIEFLEPIAPGLPSQDLMQQLSTRLESATDRLLARAA